MREIKFRARHSKTGQWYLGSSEVSGRDATTFDDTLLPLSLFWLQVEQGILDRNTVGQWIWLSDKNGKEIYEGDIIKYYYGAVFHNVEVFWDVITSGWQFGIHKVGLSPQNFDVYEVIGNIYENPELLEK